MSIFLCACQSVEPVDYNKYKLELTVKRQEADKNTFYSEVYLKDPSDEKHTVQLPGLTTMKTPGMLGAWANLTLNNVALRCYFDIIEENDSFCRLRYKVEILADGKKQLVIKEEILNIKKDEMQLSSKALTEKPPSIKNDTKCLK